MKKVLSLILSVLVIMVSAAAVPVFAITVDDIAITVGVYDITVKVTSATDGTMAAQLVNDANNALLGMDEDSTPALVNGKYEYEFNFNMQYTVPTGTYKVRVGGNVPETEKSFRYVRLDDKITFYDTLDTKAAGEIKPYFATNLSSVPVDITEYNNLSDKVLALVDAKISALNLATGLTSASTTAEKTARIVALDTLFAAEFNAYMTVAKIADVSSSEWQTVLADAIAATTFNGYFYDSATAGTAALTAAEVYQMFKAEAAKVTTLDMAEYVKAFNAATILTIELEKDYTTLKNAFLYFEDNSMFPATPDMTNIDALVAAGNDTDLWKDLKAMANPDVATLISNAENIASSMTAGGTGTGGTGGGSTGGTGGGGGGTAVGEITKPGASAGIVPQEPAKITFADLTQAEWAREAVEALAADGIINGKTASIYAPNDSMTREEFVKVLIGAFDLLEESATCDFNDVSPDRWSYGYIASANRTGLVTGDGKNFNPTDTISRQDMAVIIYRLFELAGTEISGTPVNFTDSNAISAYASVAVSALSGAGVINGMGDGTFAPRASVTRAQAAKVIYEVLTLMGGIN